MVWLLGYVQSNTHDRLKEDLEKEDVEIWFPTEKVLTKPKRKKKPVTVERPLFGNYVFIRKTECWSAIMGHRYLISMVKMAGEYVVATDQIVEHMKTVEWTDDPSSEPKFSPGELVVIEDVPTLEGVMGVVVQCSSTDVWFATRGWVLRVGVYFVRSLGQGDSRTRLSDPVAPTVASGGSSPGSG